MTFSVILDTINYLKYFMNFIFKKTFLNLMTLKLIICPILYYKSPFIFSHIIVYHSFTVKEKNTYKYDHYY